MDESPRQRRAHQVLLALAAALGLSLLLLSYARTAQECVAWDSVAQRACARRVVELEGGIYVAGTDHKGPLWSSCYVLAWYLAPDPARYWSVIAVGVLLLTLSTAEVARRLVLALGGGPPAALAAGLSLLILPAIEPDPELARLLYSRALTSLLTGVALLGALHARRLGPLRLGGAGLALGLAVQTMPTTLAPAVAVGLALGWRLRGADARERALRSLWFAVPFLLPLAAVPLYYALRGELGDFWAQWFTYNRLYNEALGLSPLERLRLLVWGAARLVWHRHPRSWWVFALVGLAVLAGALHGRLAPGRARPRALTLGAGLVLVWWLAELASLSASLRFYRHYATLLTLPATVACGLVLGTLVSSRSRTLQAALPLGLVLAFCLIWRGEVRRSADSSASEGRIESARRQGLALEAALASVLSERGAYVYDWAQCVLLYSELDRRAPTRYVENRWLRGEIYYCGDGKVRSPDYVLPRTWERWQADVAATPPVMFFEHLESPVDAGTPAQAWLEERFALVASGPKRRIYALRERQRWFGEALRALKQTPPEPALRPGPTCAVEAVGGPDLEVLRFALEPHERPGTAEVAFGAESCRVTLPATPEPGELVVCARNGALLVMQGAEVADSLLAPAEGQAVRLEVRFQGLTCGAVQRVRRSPPWPTAPGP